MHKKTVIVISSVIIVVIVLAYIIMNVASMPTLYVDPTTINREIGEDFLITISVSNVADLYAWQFKLSWNSAILDFLSIAEGPFLQSSGNTTFDPRTENSTQGYIFVVCRLVGETSGVSGNGILAAISFHVKAGGNCNLDLSETMLVNSGEQQIGHRTVGGRFGT